MEVYAMHLAFVLLGSLKGHQIIRMSPRSQLLQHPLRAYLRSPDLVAKQACCHLDLNDNGNSMANRRVGREKADSR